MKLTEVGTDRLRKILDDTERSSAGGVAARILRRELEKRQTNERTDMEKYIVTAEDTSVKISRLVDGIYRHHIWLMSGVGLATLELRIAEATRIARLLNQEEDKAKIAAIESLDAEVKP